MNVNDATSNSAPASPSRRRFLTQAIAVGGAAGLGVACTQQVQEPNALRPGASGSRTVEAGEGVQVSAEPKPRLLPGAVDGRVLVIVEMRGGNDGLSTVIPMDNSALYDLRPDLATPEQDILKLSNRVGLHPELHRLHSWGVTTVEGVGAPTASLSHFAMQERWARGDMGGDDATFRTGFLGRLTDAVDNGSPLVGVSTSGPSAALYSAQASTLSFNDPGQLWFLRQNDWAAAQQYRRGVEAMSQPGDPYRVLIDLADATSDLDEWEDYGDAEDGSAIKDMVDHGGNLGRDLLLASELIHADVGVRVIHAVIDGFDTHDDHRWAHPDLLGKVDAAVGGFLRRVDDLGMGDRVLVATTSEFGRRVGQNGQGLDHGVASSMLVAGPIPDRQLGEPPPLHDLDEDGNLRPTVPFDRYLAGLAQDWLGVEAASVLPNTPEPLAIL